MSPRKPAALRDGDGQNLREYLIATAARLIDQRGSAGLAVRDIAREARVADGVLYNYFEDKEDLLAHALLAHVGAVMASTPQMPQAGTASVAENLRLFIDGGLAALGRVVPAFAGLLSQPKVLSRFYAMVGGEGAFGAATAGDDDTGRQADQDNARDGSGNAPDGSDNAPDGSGNASHGHGDEGLPAILAAYLRAEQQLGRIDRAADIETATALIIGAIHGQVLPRVLFSPPGSPITTPPDLARHLAETILSGIAPGSSDV
jgi:AcrR family transcriptional regulator